MMQYSLQMNPLISSITQGKVTLKYYNSSRLRSEEGYLFQSSSLPLS